MATLLALYTGLPGSMRKKAQLGFVKLLKGRGDKDLTFKLYEALSKSMQKRAFMVFIKSLKEQSDIMIPVSIVPASFTHAEYEKLPEDVKAELQERFIKSLKEPGDGVIIPQKNLVSSSVALKLYERLSEDEKKKIRDGFVETLAPKGRYLLDTEVPSVALGLYKSLTEPEKNELVKSGKLSLINSSLTPMQILERQAQKRRAQQPASAPQGAGVWWPTKRRAPNPAASSSRDV